MPPRRKMKMQLTSFLGADPACAACRRMNWAKLSPATLPRRRKPRREIPSQNSGVIVISITGRIETHTSSIEPTSDLVPPVRAFPDRKACALTRFSLTPGCRPRAARQSSSTMASSEARPLASRAIRPVGLAILRSISGAFMRCRHWAIVGSLERPHSQGLTRSERPKASRK